MSFLYRLPVKCFVKPVIFGHKLGQRLHSLGGVADEALFLCVLRLLFVQKLQRHSLAYSHLFRASEVLLGICLDHYFPMRSVFKSKHRSINVLRLPSNKQFFVHLWRSKLPRRCQRFLAAMLVRFCRLG
jgi:hypothetical protein